MEHGSQPPEPVMTLAQVDEALLGMRTDQARITENLLELEGTAGYRFLHGGELHGRTRQRWLEASEDLARLWQLFDVYQRLVDAAEARRGTQRRLGSAELRDLTHLLRGPSIELPWDTGGLADRSLLDPRRGHVTPSEALEHMVERYGRATAVVTSADAAWKVLHPRLRTVEDLHEEAVARATELGDAPDDLTDLSSQVDQLRDTVRTDPLSLLRADAPTDRTDDVAAAVDTTALDALRERLIEVRDRLDAAVATRDNAATALHTVRTAAEDVRRAARDANEQLAGIRARIAASALEPIPETHTTLEPQLERLGWLHTNGRWEELDRLLRETHLHITSLAGAVESAASANRARLHRRDELRGRMDAYRVKAARLGRAEEPRVHSAQEHAEKLLWEAPCDLPAAAEAVEQYQRALNERA
ncbi:hypothetical protein J4H86_25300 [Spiractinospora alimapuensis]|uniref:hypothetical protein n=1 Tax=Spiractinospora alimapuensis TaxID=2820884 RepID=UPI001F337794|nr:hypothetical protein [Spiractinospora alimapuensis]QVQ52010.1 hypothetical protein J4H86_25300 [Spiractinospora alimapuensis]